MIHHLNWIESDLIIIGYFNKSNDYQPSIAAVSFNYSSSQCFSLIDDLKDPVCNSEEFNENHKYFLRYFSLW